MAKDDAKGTTGDHYLVAVFDDAAAFRGGLQALLSARFDRARISVLAEHRIVADRFGGTIPPGSELADRPETPREDLDTEGALHKAIDVIAEGVSLIGMVGTAAMAYVLGGPVGVATGIGSSTEATVAGVLQSHVDDSYKERFAESVRDGGVVCWVHVHGPVEDQAARRALLENGAGDVHEIGV